MRSDEFKYYRPVEGWDRSSIYAYAADGSQDDFIIPDLVLMTDAEVDDFYEERQKIDEAYNKIAAENSWRDSEIRVVKDNLDAILFEDPDALPGTESQWKAYGVALRRWKEGAEGYPHEEHRPSRPA
ncbi:hypothetical protein [Pseudomonas sp. F16(2018)]|uniref:hypothetical protein n=1 Tax=Pseudomonas sp. F16(2018) TaxID=2093746 RepID=UPI001119BF04|nr:hypothetical protein [Pseudomonas sp. F16(2018)]